MGATSNEPGTLGTPVVPNESAAFVNQEREELLCGDRVVAIEEDACKDSTCERCGRWPTLMPISENEDYSEC